MSETKWYEFYQNNSGGSFTPPGRTVWIEAVSTIHANERALDIGIYFDGVNNGVDCDCCGDRWSRANECFARVERPTEGVLFPLDYVIDDWS